MSLHTSHAVSGHTVFTRRTFDQAIRPIYVPLCRHAAMRCGTDAEQDLVQSALACAWSVIERFDAAHSPCRLLAWLIQFVDFACDDFLRSSARRPVDPITADDQGRLEEQPADDTAELTLAYRAELYTLITRARLTPRQEECLRGWLDGRSQQRIARDLGLDSRTVWESIEEAKRRLRRCQLSEEVTIREVFDEEARRTVYIAPEAVGAALAREQLARLALQDARYAARCRRNRHATTQRMKEPTQRMKDEE